MKQIWWILGVMAVAAVAFFVPGQSGYLWAPLISAMAVAGIFFIGLGVYVWRKGRSGFDQVFGIGVLALLALLTIYSGISNYRASTRQYDYLMHIRLTIEKGISKAYTQQTLLELLREYHQQPEGEETTISDLFNARYNDFVKDIDGQLRFIPEDQQEHSEESPFIFLEQTTSPDSIVLVAQSLRIQGWDSMFNNFNGQTGKMQFQAVLTEGGVSYEREN